ncbi:YdcF family protein [Phocoenobacter skyensis]|uniref:YdcF family protein n=1 Tax=Phocoenobacter skyensis TaxID=97481 RepID=UPI003B75B739
MVTDRWHMKRTKLHFEHLGYKILPASVDYSQRLNFGMLSLIPQFRALYNSSLALKERIGYCWVAKICKFLPITSRLRLTI